VNDSEIYFVKIYDIDKYSVCQKTNTEFECYAQMK
jgi:hypothetical protein